MSELETLPEGWVLGTIEDSGEYINGFAFKPQHRSETGLPIIRIQNLTDENKPIHLTDIEVDPAYKVVDGDILVSWSATLDTFIWRRGPALVNQHIFKVVPETKLIEKKLLFYWLKIAIEDLQKTEHLHGSTMKHINRGPFMAHSLPFPPKNEQTRIVEKLEELLSDLDNGVAELKAAQIKLTQYRQSLLKSAVEGSLTAEWRSKNQPTETGQQLLQRILEERRQRWEQQKLAEFKEKGKKPPKDWQLKYPEPVQPDTSELPELPEGWVWASLSQIGWIDRGRSKHRPRSAKHLYDGKYPFVQTGDIRNSGQYITSTYKTYSDAGLAQSKLWPKGTMCITIAANIGETSILSFDACFPDSVVGFIPVLPEQNIEYIEYSFRTIKEKLDAEAPATAQKNINLEILAKEVLPLPPISEQEKILEELNRGFSQIESQLNYLSLGLKQADAQRKNILKDAFSGKLVPQNANDEPASVLLDKIKAERLAQAKLSKPKRAKKKANNKASIMDTLFEVLKAKGDWMDAQEAFRACGVTDGGDFSDIVDKVESLYAELRKLEKEEKLIEIRRVGNYDQLKLRNGKVS